MRRGILKRNVIAILTLSRIVFSFFIWFLFLLNGYTADIAVFVACLSAPSTVLVFAVVTKFIAGSRYISTGEQVPFESMITWYVFAFLVALPQVIIVVSNGLFNFLSSITLLLILGVIDSGLCIYMVVFSSKFLLSEKP